MRKLICLILVLTFFISGCMSPNTSDIPNSGVNQESSSPISSSAPNTVEESDFSRSKISDIDTSKIQGKIKKVE